ncbi:putative leader peptide [Amycolatopsis sulphurea]|uniref:putative leader peptide n=1 Tax=Amycolatopsis sulphurea TaxID=76022 RepID=UPI000BF81F31
MPGRRGSGGGAQVCSHHPDTVDHLLSTWQSGPVSPAGVLLVARRHVDLLRVASALCRHVR